jgi:siroheme synthase
VTHVGAPTTGSVTGSGVAGTRAEPVTRVGAPTTGSVTSSGVTGVSLAGAGPGDPDLMTLRAEALLAAAAIVVVDTCVTHLAVGFAPRATIVSVPDRVPAVDALLDAAGAGGPVVRLYVGDTWLHPAHGPESAALATRGIAFEAVAGVAIEVALPGLAGIPVHVRQAAIACTFAAAAAAPPATDPARTLVVVADDLRAAAVTIARTGDPSLPAAAIEAAGPTTRATLGELASIAPRRPGVLVTGAVVTAATAEATGDTQVPDRDLGVTGWGGGRGRRRAGAR